MRKSKPKVYDIRRAFDSWSEYVSYCENTEKNGTLAMAERASRTDYKSFANTKDFSQAISLAGEGWTDKARELEKVSAPLVDRILSKVERFDPRHDIEGQFIDVARFVQNEPECWVSMVPETVENFSQNKSKLIRIVFDGGVSSRVTPETIFARGAAVVALVNILECAGYSVELTKFVLSTQQIKSKDNKWTETVIVKSFDQPLHLGQVAFALCHPSALRRLTMSVMETEDKGAIACFGFSTKGTYGHPRPIPDEEQKDFDIVLTGRNHFTGAVANISAWVESEIRRQVIELRDEKHLAY